MRSLKEVKDYIKRREMQLLGCEVNIRSAAYLAAQGTLGMMLWNEYHRRKRNVSSAKRYYPLEVREDLLRENTHVLADALIGLYKQYNMRLILSAGKVGSLVIGNIQRIYERPNYQEDVEANKGLDKEIMKRWHALVLEVQKVGTDALCGVEENPVQRYREIEERVSLETNKDKER